MSQEPRPQLRVLERRGFAERNDLELVEAYKDAATRALAAREIMRRYGRLVHRILRGGLGPTGDVQDLVQDIFMRIFGRLASLKNPELLKYFVASFAVNVLKAQLKQRTVRRRRLEALAQAPSASWPDHDGREAWRRLSAILDTLDARDRALFVLRYMEEMTVDEVVIATGVSRGTAKRRLAEAWRRVSAAVVADPVLAAYVGAGFAGEGRGDR